MTNPGLLAAMQRAVENAPRIFVYRHTNPDPDAIGSQFGLVQLLRTAFPDKPVVAVGSVPNHLTWIATNDTPPQQPTAADLLVMVDCANHDRIAGHWRQDAPIIKIDHHPNRDSYGTLNWVDAGYSSCSEMIYALYAADRTRLTMTTTIATLLYAGIIGDTVGFSTPATSAKTLATASQLAAYGVDIATVSHHAADLTPQLAKLSGYILSHLEVDELGLAHVVLSQPVLQSLAVPYGDEDAIVALPGNLANVTAWLIFVATPQGNYRVHLRSKRVPIDAVAKRFGGGGHALASGTFVADLDQVTQLVTVAHATLATALITEQG
ncbi:DHH family phosphoesterase [Lactiplantibacillus plajomi]|uniref:Bifunctional oligoribonuclease/PAP phosphatase NrnA n=1 Tax=Lactiplantibacillus plajomi TaxID=1457217 RepID=A0ABV6JZH2_9LACO|nr:bifunctional oligoribonuclease/PAP phosphatase NrnA [Lactiplantibacillus plajomi]